MEGSRATDVKVGLVVRLQHPDEVITLFLKTKMKKSTLKSQARHDCDYFTDGGATNFMKFIHMYEISSSVYVEIRARQLITWPSKTLTDCWVFMTDRLHMLAQPPPYHKA